MTDGRFHAFAVRSRWGPHVTLQAGVVHLGRHWTTTTRGSVKADAVRRWASASVTVDEGGGRYRILAGPSRVLDGLRPTTLLRSPLDSVLAGGALARLLGTNLDQLLGYAEAAGEIPGAFLPWGRVLLDTAADDELVLEGREVTAATGRWATAMAGPHRLRPGAPGRRRGWQPPRTSRPVPRRALAMPGCERDCLLGVDTPSGPVALPGRWDPETSSVAVAATGLQRVGAQLPGPLCVTFDDSADRRPDRKIGLMLRGRGTAAAAGRSTTRVTVDTDRLTHWDGFGSGSAAVMS